VPYAGERRSPPPSFFARQVAAKPFVITTSLACLLRHAQEAAGRGEKTTAFIESRSDLQRCQSRDAESAFDRFFGDRQRHITAA
jgi:hypothetical protein